MVTRNAKLPFPNVCIELTKRKTTLPSEDIGSDKLSLLLTLSVLTYPLSTSRNQVLVQSQCYCQFLVGSTGEPFKNRLLFHRLESQYRARTYVTEYVSCFVSLARLRQTQQTCSRCIAPRRSIGTQHTKAPRE